MVKHLTIGPAITSKGFDLLKLIIMKIQIKSILEAHRARTGEVVSQSQLAREMTSEGLFCSFASARGMIYYNTSGKAKSLDIEMIEFLKRRFNLTTCEVIED